ncbi:ribonuclease H-like domain-containing protein [Tanacetum coccineum]
MKNKSRGNKSICEKWMTLMANIVKVSYISMAKIGFRESAPPQTMPRTARNSATSLPRYPKNLRSQEPVDSSKRVSYPVNPRGMNGSSLNMIKDDESSIDREASDFIKTVREKNFKDASEIMDLSESILPPPPRIMFFGNRTVGTNTIVGTNNKFGNTSTPLALHTAPGPIQPLMGYSNPLGFFFSPSSNTAGHETLFPNAFRTMNTHDSITGNCNMDTGANSHHDDFVYSLSDVFNMCIYPSVSVGDDGTLSRYKARLIANGSIHLDGVNVDETFSLVVKLGTIQTILSLATSRHWPVHQLDVKNAFLHGDLSKTGKYAAEILERAYMVNCNPSRTLVDTESKLGDDGDPTSDPALYRSLVGSLQYITFTSQYISYVVQHVYLYMHDPREPYFSALKRILSAETEYCGVANDVAETCRLRNLLRELHTHLSSATLVYCDNVSAVYLSANPVQHQCTKYH